MEGWIKLYRKFLKWEWYSDTNTTRLFLHLILKANHKTKGWQGVKLEEGQLITGRKVLSKETRLTEQQIRTCLSRLKSTNEIAIKTTSQYSIITLNNWKQYQSNQPTDQPTINQPSTTNKNDKNDKNKRIYNEQFEIFYNEYPKKVDRKLVENRFNKIMQNNPDLFQEIMQGLKDYKKQIQVRNTQKQYIKSPVVWLNKESWQDEYETETQSNEESIPPYYKRRN